MVSLKLHPLKCKRFGTTRESTRASLPFRLPDG